MKWTPFYLDILICYSGTNENQAPLCSITNPGNGEEIELGQIIIISASAEDPDGTVSEVVFYLDDVKISSVDTLPYSISWDTHNEDLGNHQIKAEAKDDFGGITPSEITITMVQNTPLITTNQIRDISSSAAICGGNITDEGAGIVSARGVCWSTIASPTPEERHTIDGSGAGEFSSAITDLVPQTRFYVRAYATNSTGTAYGQEQVFTTAGPQLGTLEDIDGNRYTKTQIGSQIWMAENLRVIHYADGSPIPYITDQNEWEKLGDNDTDKAHCWYDNDSLRYAGRYGALYTYAAAVNGTPWDGISDIQGVCPDGWHVHSDSDWYILENYIKDNGYYFEVGTMLKSKEGWYNMDRNPVIDGTNAFHFAGLPGGQRNWREESAFTDVGILRKWWDSMEDPASSHTVGQAYGLISNNPTL